MNRRTASLVIVGLGMAATGLVACSQQEETAAVQVEQIPVSLTEEAGDRRVGG
ncbi:MAG: hypothetical protein HYV08_03590 [Deltaproteobacteria bacterium]|nr:hypothetical protein [Deltaproteobacteria bacterium]MBI3078622.1 hypothetical protein [Deltaproteobacteria bacterium]